VNRRLLIDLSKYLLAVGLLAWVVRSNWSPPPTRAIASLGAGTVGLCAAPGGAGPLLAAAASLPGRVEPKGLGHVWRRHVVEGQPVNAGYLAAGFALYTAAVLMTMLRWHLLVRALGLPLRLRDALRYGLVGHFFNAFLPGSVGGDLVKAAALARAQSRRTAAVATVIMDRVLGLWALVWFVALAGGVFRLTAAPGPIVSLVVSIAQAVVSVTTALWILLWLLPDQSGEGIAVRLARLPLVGPTASELFRAAWVYRARLGTVAGVLLLSGVVQVGFVVAYSCSARALWSPELGVIPTLGEHFVLVPLGLVMQSLVPTPGGVGGGEWGFASLYLLFRSSEAAGVLASLVQRLFSWSLGLAGYVIYLWTATAREGSSPPEVSADGRQAEECPLVTAPLA
jgi:glycosyltransferase 2 family protein